MATPRKSHMLGTTRGAMRPTSVIFFDTETKAIEQGDKVEKHRLKLGAACHARSINNGYLNSVVWTDFTAAGDFWQWVNDRIRDKSTTYITAHNIVFDLVVLNGFNELSRSGWSLQSFYTKGLTSIFRWKQGNRKIIAVDNGNLFPGALDRWGKILNLPKLKVSFDTVTDKDLLIYCKRDVEIMLTLWRTWLNFLDENQCGAFKSTVGSTAFNTWRYRFLKSPVHIHNNPGAMAIEREAYKGARVECLYQGRREGSTFYYMDVNNMYGYVLERYQYPTGLMGFSEHGSINILLRKLERYAVVAECMVNVSGNPFPFVLDGHTCYPVGRFVTTLTTPEIMLALQQGWIEGVGRMAWYKQADLFRDYVLTFSELRQKYRAANNPGFAEISKLMVNSLYGKFGQRAFTQKQIGETDPEELWSMTVFDRDTKRYSRHIALAGKVYEETHEGESYQSFPAIAAHVTAYARLYLYRLISMVPTGHVFYMDTDSLIVDEIGYQALNPMMHNTRVGYLKVELSSPWVEINAPKDYAMEGRRRLKGVSPSAINLGEGAFLMTQWLRLDGMIQAGDMDGYTTRKVIKHQRRNITSGIVNRSGWVEPYRLDIQSIQTSEVKYDECVIE